jgi:hypothetical protein
MLLDIVPPNLHYYCLELLTLPRGWAPLKDITPILILYGCGVLHPYNKVDLMDTENRVSSLVVEDTRSSGCPSVTVFW